MADCQPTENTTRPGNQVLAFGALAATLGPSVLRRTESSIVEPKGAGDLKTTDTVPDRVCHHIEETDKSEEDIRL